MSLTSLNTENIVQSMSDGGHILAAAHGNAGCITSMSELVSRHTGDVIGLIAEILIIAATVGLAVFVAISGRLPFLPPFEEMFNKNK